VFGTLEQPTIQGFTVIALGFSLTALKSVNPSSEAAPALNPRSGQLGYSMRA
jgi:hypothetical protein